MKSPRALNLRQRIHRRRTYLLRPLVACLWIRKHGEATDCDFSVDTKQAYLLPQQRQLSTLYEIEIDGRRR